MRRVLTSVGTTAVLICLASSPAHAQQTPVTPVGGNGCKAYYAVVPLDQNTLKILATPVLPPNATAFADSNVRQLRDWDLPPKVTAWRERPSPDELARRWNELNKTSKVGGIPRPYGLQLMAAEDWKDLDKWFAKEAPKKLPGLCLGSERANYVLAVGIVSLGTADRSLASINARNEYQQTAVARQQDAAVGPNAATYSPGVREINGQELSGMSGGDSSRPGAYTCAFWFRKSQNGVRNETPDYYYCKADSVMPRSAATTMLKYLAKASEL